MHSGYDLLNLFNNNRYFNLDVNNVSTPLEVVKVAFEQFQKVQKHMLIERKKLSKTYESLNKDYLSLKTIPVVPELFVFCVIPAVFP